MGGAPPTPPNINEQIDVSLLFDSTSAAQSAWAGALQASGVEHHVAEDQLNAVARLALSPIPTEDLDARLMPEPFRPGEAFIGIHFGGMNQLELRRMLTNPTTGKSAYPPPWAEGSLMRTCSRLVERALGAGAAAVVLHKAAGAIKPKALFLEELSKQGHRAWLDLVASHDGQGGVLCRSYGMPNYFGAPNVQAATRAADAESVECAMGAVRFLCLQIVEENQAPFSVTKVTVPPFTVGETSLPGVTWTAAHDEATLTIRLSRP